MKYTKEMHLKKYKELFCNSAHCMGECVQCADVRKINEEVF